jgi:hypothetical protein
MPSKNLELFLVGRDLSASKALKNLSKEAERTSTIGGKIGTAFKVGSLAAAGAVAALAVESVHLAAAYEQADTRLRVAVTNVGASFKALQPQVHELDDRMVHLGFSGADTESALSGLVSATKNPTESIKLMGLAADIARGRNIDLSTATSILVKVETGHVGLLGRLGIATKDASGKTISATEAVKKLSDLYGGQAQAHADTFAGKMQVLKVEGEEIGVKFGQALIPVLEKTAGVLLTGAHDAEAAAHWLKQHKVEAEALAAVIGGLLIPKLALLGAQYATLGLAKVGMLFEGLTTGTGKLGGALTGLISPMGVLGAGVAGVTFEVVHGINVWKGWNSSLDAVIAENEKTSSSFTDMETALAHFETKASKAAKPNWHSTFTDPFGGARHAAREATDATDTYNRHVGELTDSLGISKDMAAQFANTAGVDLTHSLTAAGVSMSGWTGNVVKLAAQLGMTTTGVIAVIDSLGPAIGKQLTQPWEKDGAAVAAVKDKVYALADAAGVSLPRMSALTGGSVTKMQSLSNAVKTAGEETSKAFIGATNVVQNFTGDTSLTKYFNTTVAGANKFADNIQIATKRGLDPQLIQQLLEAGPQKAAPILDAIVKDHSGRMVSLANASETALSKINSEVVRMSQLTTLAINAPKKAAEQMAEELPAALKIAQLQMANHSLTVAQVASALGISKAKAQQIGADFGITFSSTVAKNVHTTITATTHGTGSTQSVSIQGGGTMGRRAGGGPVLPYQDYIVGEHRPEILRMGASGGFVYPSVSSAPRGARADHMTTVEGQEIIRLLREVIKVGTQSNQHLARTPAAIVDVFNGVARR